MLKQHLKILYIYIAHQSYLVADAVHVCVGLLDAGIVNMVLIGFL